MAVKIRLRRMGTHKRPFYRVIVADARSPVSYTHLTLPTILLV